MAAWRLACCDWVVSTFGLGLGAGGPEAEFQLLWGHAIPINQLNATSATCAVVPRILLPIVQTQESLSTKQAPSLNHVKPQRLKTFIWVAVKELELSYYIGEALLFTAYTHYGNLI